MGINQAQIAEQMKTDIARTMAGLEQQFSKMAAHPDRPQAKGPILVKRDSRANPGNDNDSLMGTLMIESFVGGSLMEHFAEALDMPSWAKNVDWGNLVDAYDEFHRDRTNGGSVAPEKPAQMRGMFNDFASLEKALQKQAWNAQRPQREKMESQYAVLSRELDMLEPVAQKKIYPAPSL